MSVRPEVRTSASLIQEHVLGLGAALTGLSAGQETLGRWGEELAARLGTGQRLLVAGNGGSAAEAQHLTAELVGRFDGEREAFSAIALHAETSAVTAIGNDYGFDEVFARQVRAHGREGDVLLLLTTSGRSVNLLRAASAAAEAGVRTWAMTGPGPNPLTRLVDEHVSIDAPAPHVQECQLVAIHALCVAFEAALPRPRALLRRTS